MTGREAVRFAVGIIAVGGFTELYRFRKLCRRPSGARKFCAAPKDDDEQTGGVRIKRATVTDFLDAELAADGVHDIVRGAEGLSMRMAPVERGKVLHGCLVPKSLSVRP